MSGVTGRPLPQGWCWASLDDLSNSLLTLFPFLRLPSRKPSSQPSKLNSPSSNNWKPTSTPNCNPPKLQSAQALRQSILKHAFTGKLVPQDPDDEPASELLQRIAAERKARVQEAAAAKRRRLASRRSRK